MDDHIFTCFQPSRDGFYCDEGGIIMSRGTKILSGASIAVLVWIILMVALSIFADGQIYYIEEPIYPVAISQNRVVLHFDRMSRLSMVGECSRELVCNGMVIPYAATTCVMERDHSASNMGTTYQIT